MMYVLFAFIGVVVMLTIAYTIQWKMSGGKAAHTDPRKAQQELNDFKLQAKRIVVPLRECEVISNSHTEEVLRSSNYRVQALDSLYGDGSSNIKQVNITQSRILFRFKDSAGEITYAGPVIVIDRTTLLFRLDLQKETTLYVDKNDAGKFYFDLEFLAVSSSGVEN